MVESNMKFGSLQQHYKLLKNQHDDLVEECANNKTKSTKEYNGLKDKLKRVTIELNEELRKKDDEIQSLKVTFNYNGSYSRAFWVDLLSHSEIMSKSVDNCLSISLT